MRQIDKKKQTKKKSGRTYGQSLTKRTDKRLTKKKRREPPHRRYFILLLYLETKENQRENC